METYLTSQELSTILNLLDYLNASNRNLRFDISVFDVNGERAGNVVRNSDDEQYVFVDDSLLE